jgi:hypothetical protein
MPSPEAASRYDRPPQEASPMTPCMLVERIDDRAG